MSTFTQNLNLQMQAVNENNGTWGTVLNTNVVQLIDNALGGTFSANVAGNSNITLTTSQAGYLIHDLTGILTGNIQYIFPANIGRFLIINNNTTGNFTVTVLTSGGTGIIVPQGLSSPISIDSSTQIANFLGIPSSAGMPKGRLTLSSNTPIITADATAQTSIYYTPYIGNSLPIYNGTIFINTTFAQLTLTLNTTNHPQSQVFDIYASLQSGNVILSAMYWGNNSSRSSNAGGKSGTGNATITQINGIWVNNAPISASDSFNGATGYAIPQYQGTYLGSFITGSAGQTSIALKPAAASGGSDNLIGVFNAYNRVKAYSICRDSTSTWTYGSATWRPADNNINNRVAWVDGLQQVNFAAKYVATVQFGANNNVFYLGASLNSISAGPNIVAVAEDNFGLSQTIVSSESFYPQLGFNYVQAMEYSLTGTQTIYANGSSQYLQWDGEI